MESSRIILLCITICSIYTITGAASADPPEAVNLVQSATSRLKILLLHWSKSNSTGSYLRILNSPSATALYELSYTTASNKTGDITIKDPNTSNISVTHDEIGVGVVPLMLGTDVGAFNLTIKQLPSADSSVVSYFPVTVSSYSDLVYKDYATAAAVFFPHDHQNVNVSLLLDKNQPVWDTTDNQYWIINASNPQQLQINVITAHTTSLYCFVCHHGLSDSLSNYTITVTANGVTNTTSLLGRTTDPDGTIKIPNPQMSEVENITFTLTFSYPTPNSNYETVIVETGRGNMSRSPAKEYSNTYASDVQSSNVYINEVHFPQPNGKASERTMWLEIIGPAQTNLSSYCLALSTISEGKTVSTPCLITNSTTGINNNGYFSWELWGDESESWLRNLKALAQSKPYIDHDIKLYREDKVEYTLLDTFSFRWFTSNATDSDYGHCSAVPSQRCVTTDKSKCDSLCINSTLLSDPGVTLSLGFSRCGIIKDSTLLTNGTKMSVWYMKKPSKKAWNSCPVPKGYLSRIDITNSIITVKTEGVSALESLDPSLRSSHLHLPNIGLMLVYWRYQTPTSSTPGALIPVPLTGADLTIDDSTGEYPMQTMRFTLKKKGDATRQGANLTVIGSQLSQAGSSVSAVALVQYYSFLPAFDAVQQQGQIVDAVVFCENSSPLSAKIVTTFMNMKDSTNGASQGQIVAPKSLNTVLSREPINKTETIERRATSAWKDATLGAPYTTPLVMYLLSEAQSHLRINRVGNNNHPYVELKIAESDMTSDLREFYSTGIPVDRLCLCVVQQPQRSVGTKRVLSTVKLSDSESTTIRMGETKQFGLEKFLPGTESYFGGTNESYVVLYIMLKADDICGDPNSLSIPSEVQGQRLPLYPDRGVIVDLLKFHYNQYKISGSLKLDNTTELLRCNSMRKALNPAFSVVDLNGTCPIPTHLFIYKLCQGRLGITTEDEDMIPFPTDYLRIYQLTGNNITKSVRVTAKLLRNLHNDVILPKSFINSSLINGVALGWFPDGRGRLHDLVSNQTISVIVIYPDTDQMSEAKNVLNSLLETSDDYQKAKRPIALFKPEADDKRHCMLGCVRGTALQNSVDYEPDDFQYEDLICEDDYNEFRNIRINEINVDTRGFADRREFLEIIGPPNFRYAAGLTVAILEADGDGHIVYKYFQAIAPNISTGEQKRFDGDGFFIFHQNQSQDSPLSSQVFYSLRFIPNKVGAVALMWGASMLRLHKQQFVTSSHINMPDLYLDAVIYANNYSTAINSPEIKSLRAKFQKKMEKYSDNVAIETLNAHTSLETISRCFCNDSFNMDCYDMSFNETMRHKNSCPTQFRMQLQLCHKKTDGKLEKMRSQVKEGVTLFMHRSSLCVEASCQFSSHQIIDNRMKSCVPVGKSDTVMWNITIGFPSEIHLYNYSTVLTTANLIESSFFALELKLEVCGEASCPVQGSEPTPAPTSPHKGKVAVIAGAVGGLVIVVILIVIIVIVVRKHKRRRHLSSAHFEASNDDEDDATFLPDGRISFSNPWYNQMNTISSGGGNTNGNSNGVKRQYSKLSNSDTHEDT